MKIFTVICEYSIENDVVIRNLKQVGVFKDKILALQEMQKDFILNLCKYLKESTNKEYKEVGSKIKNIWDKTHNINMCLDYENLQILENLELYVNEHLSDDITLSIYDSAENLALYYYIFETELS